MGRRSGRAAEAWGRSAAVGALAACMISGCAAGGGRRSTEDSANSSGPVGKPRPAAIVHLVLIRLKDPLDTAALADACLAMAEQIPSIKSAFAGTHLETGRATVVADYDVCFVVEFDSVEDYEAYLSHPAHVRNVQEWGPRMEWIRIHDAQDVRP